MKETTIKLLPPVLICLLGLTLIRWWLRGDLVYYLHPDMIWLTASGGVVLVAVALAAIADRGRLRPTLPQWLVLIVVVGLMVLQRPAPLSGTLAEKRQSGDALPVASRSIVNLDKLSQHFTILDWQYAWESDPTHERYLGKPVTVTGFVLAEGEGHSIARLVITCCALDARPVRLPLDASQPYPPAGTWVTVDGVMAMTGSEPLVRVTRVTVVEPPNNPYLH